MTAAAADDKRVLKEKVFALSFMKSFMVDLADDVIDDVVAINGQRLDPIALIREANRLPYALAAYCFTENGRRQNRLGEDIEAGMIAVNQLALSWPDSPFGGIKDSGFGSEDGPEGVMAHLVTKTFHMK